MFFVFEGIDGSGKSTQLNLFAQWLESNGQSVVVCKDPGSTVLGENLRSILLQDRETPIHMVAEMLMFTAARAQLVQEIIKPALASGKTIVLDRYILSTVVYQGYAGELDPDEIWTVNRIATEGVNPDLTFIFDIDVETALGRVGEAQDRMESRGSAYFEKVRAGFLAESERWPDRVEVIDAARPVSEIQNNLQQITAKYMQRKHQDL